MCFICCCKKKWTCFYQWTIFFALQFIAGIIAWNELFLGRFPTYNGVYGSNTLFATSIIAIPLSIVSIVFIKKEIKNLIFYGVLMVVHLVLLALGLYVVYCFAYIKPTSEQMKVYLDHYLQDDPKGVPIFLDHLQNNMKDVEVLKKIPLDLPVSCCGAYGFDDYANVSMKPSPTSCLGDHPEKPQVGPCTFTMPDSCCTLGQKTEGCGSRPNLDLTMYRESLFLVSIARAAAYPKFFRGEVGLGNAQSVMDDFIKEEQKQIEHEGTSARNQIQQDNTIRDKYEPMVKDGTLNQTYPENTNKLEDELKEDIKGRMIAHNVMTSRHGAPIPPHFIPTYDLHQLSQKIRAGKFDDISSTVISPDYSKIELHVNPVSCGAVFDLYITGGGGIIPDGLKGWIDFGLTVPVLMAVFWTLFLLADIWVLNWYYWKKDDFPQFGHGTPSHPQVVVVDRSKSKYSANNKSEGGVKDGSGQNQTSDSPIKPGAESSSSPSAPGPD